MSTRKSARIGADIGGTFTDVAAVGTDGVLRIGKRLTTHGAEHLGVIQAVADTGVDKDGPEAVLAHGTTLVINSLLERKGARVALVTTKGFADVLDIGRGNRSEIFNLRFHREPPLIPPEMRFEVDERTLADGRIETAVTEEELTALVERLRAVAPEAIAIGFLHAYLRPDHEKLVGERLRSELPGIPVTLSSDLSRQWREYERFTTATANAYVAPVAQRYLASLLSGLEEDGFNGQFVVLDSSGGAMEVGRATRQPVRAVESGPVGGVIAARSLARRRSIGNLVTFDMGGTTAKAALIEHGDYATRDLYWIGGQRHGFPLQVSTVDIIEVGVGGGSIAWLDETGRLHVGPASAGSQPGPASYGLGGRDATVTDANLYCGRLDKDHFSGSFTLDPDAGRAAIERLAERAGMTPERLALGIIQLANLEVAATVRKQTLERGNDPKDYAMLVSGGGGPLHGSAIAREVGIREVLIPRFPGHYSAMGMLEANLRVDRREVLDTSLQSLDVDALRQVVRRASESMIEELGGGQDAELRFALSLALKFRGQEHALWVAAPGTGREIPDDIGARIQEEFVREYLRRYGHVDQLSAVDLVEVELVAERVLPSVTVDYSGVAEPEDGKTILSLWDQGEGFVETPVRARSSLSPGDRVAGPMIVHEVGATTALPPGVVAEVLDDGVIRVILEDRRRD